MSRRILIVEDSPTLAEQLRLTLQAHGYEVTVATDGAEALEKAWRDPPDMIITDILMPVMDGFTLCREWEKDEVLKAIPFIFYTATYTDPKDEEFALSLGAERFIVKPADPDVFAEILQQVLENREAGRLAAPCEPVEEEEVYLKQYNEALIRKLEDKMLQLEETNWALEQDIIERKRAEARVEHLNLVLRAIRSVNQLIIKVKDRNRLIQGVCDRLIETRSYYNAWIALIDESDKPVATAEAGLGESFLPLVERLERGEPFHCGRMALAQADVLIIEDPFSTCTDCPLSRRYHGRGGMAIRLEHGGKIYGLLVISVSVDWAVDEEEQRLFEEVADDIAFALHSIELEEERERAEEQIKRQLDRLAALRNIDMAITASLDLRVTFNVLLNQVTTQLDVDATDVLLLNPHTQILEYVAGRGFLSTALQHTRLRLGEGHAGRAAMERRIVSIPDLSQDMSQFTHAPLLADEGFITYHCKPLIAKGQVKGVLEVFHRTPFTPDREWLDFLEALARQAAIAIDNTALFDDLQRSNVELSLAYDTTLEGWARTLELRDYETEGHSRRVTEMTLRLARAMGMSDAQLVYVRRGALLHDIGKMGISDSILLKPGPLTEEEWDIVRQHPVFAYELLSPITYLHPALDIPYCHHEKWDGTGYPRGLKGEHIPLAARIFAIVDVWDVLSSDRPYRPAWPEEKVMEHIREQAGKHFDPQVAEMFLELVVKDAGTN